ncbi:MAG: hypothetical protein KGJ86_19755 [Chloroflexota bacterium]|nr:hypothetical protein [Chloroflexota bacterium]
MNFEFCISNSADEVLAALRREAEAAYGAERARQLEATLADAARALWRVAQAGLELLDSEPDFGR